MATAVLMPRQGQSVESCILVEWRVKVGDKVEEGTPLASIETDKAVFEVESPAAGVVLEQFFGDGADIPVLTNIAAVGEPGEDVTALRPAGEGQAPPATAEGQGQTLPGGEQGQTPSAPQSGEGQALPAAVDGQGQALSGGEQGQTPSAVSPRARKAAAAAGVAVAGMLGTGPHGRVIERDVQAAARDLPRLSPAARAAAAAGGLAAPAAGSGPGGLVLSGDLTAAGAGGAVSAAAVSAAPVGEPRVIPMTGIRRLIAERMHKSLASTAQLTLTMSFDATSIMAYRQSVKSHGEALGLPNITINDLIAFATVRTLVKFPELNAHFLGDRIVRFPSVNLGVAMDTPRGLMVPVVPQADRLTLVGLSEAIKPMADAARKGAINPDLLSGGTFTITNMGMMGVETFTPVLNAPEVGILGVGGLQLKPVQAGDGVKHVQSITLSLTVDHQAVDGADGARFLKSLTTALSAIELTLAG